MLHVTSTSDPCAIGSGWTGTLLAISLGLLSLISWMRAFVLRQFSAWATLRSRHSDEQKLASHLLQCLSANEPQFSQRFLSNGTGAPEENVKVSCRVKSIWVICFQVKNCYPFYLFSIVASPLQGLIGLVTLVPRIKMQKSDCIYTNQYSFIIFNEIALLENHSTINDLQAFAFAFLNILIVQVK